MKYIALKKELTINGFLGYKTSKAMYTLLMQQDQTKGKFLAIPGGKTVAIVSSSFHPDIVHTMEEEAEKVLRTLGAANILTVHVPGAFEIPLACLHLIKQKHVEGIVALGVIIQGKTHHAAEIARACTDGLMQIQLSTTIPIAHEVLYVDSAKTARERAGGEHGKGAEAAEALACMMQILGK